MNEEKSSAKKEVIPFEKVAEISPPPEEVPLLKEFVLKDGGHPCRIDLEYVTGEPTHRLWAAVGDTSYYQEVRPDQVSTIVKAAFNTPWVFVRYEPNKKQLKSIRLIRTF